jgi:hypothetical protein
MILRDWGYLFFRKPFVVTLGDVYRFFNLYMHRGNEVRRKIFDREDQSKQ